MKTTLKQKIKEETTLKDMADKLGISVSLIWKQAQGVRSVSLEQMKQMNLILKEMKKNRENQPNYKSWRK